MNAKKFKKILTDACVYFTAAELFIIAIAELFRVNDPVAGGGISVFLSLASALTILVACVIMSAMRLIFETDLAGVLQVVLHFFGSLIAYSLVFIVIPGAWRDFGASFARVGIFLLLYFVILIISLIVKSLKQKRRSDDSEYESQFGEFYTGSKK